MSTWKWQEVPPFRLSPAPYANDQVLVVGEIEARVQTNKSCVSLDVYPESQRPPDPATGTIYGRCLAASVYIGCDPTEEARAKAAEDAKSRAESAV